MHRFIVWRVTDTGDLAGKQWMLGAVGEFELIYNASLPAISHDMNDDSGLFQLLLPISVPARLLLFICKLVHFAVLASAAS